MDLCIISFSLFMRNPLDISLSVYLHTSWWCLSWVGLSRRIYPTPPRVSVIPLLPCPAFALAQDCHALPVPFFSCPAFSSALLVRTNAQQERTRRPFCLIRCGWVSILSYLVHWCNDILVYCLYCYNCILVYWYTCTLLYWYILVYWYTGMLVYSIHSGDHTFILGWVSILTYLVHWCNDILVYCYTCILV